MSSYEKLMEMDGDEVYSLAKDKYHTVVIKCNAVYLEEKEGLHSSSLDGQLIVCICVLYIWGLW